MIKGARGILLVLCALAAAPAVAGTVYRCDGADGARSYSSKRVSNAVCKAVAHSDDRISGYSARQQAAAAPKAPAVTAAAATPAAPTSTGQG